ncbi:MAG: hypothetical protein IH820_02975 [Bacteroidetes bacterium]|nr:hypothetical protein [Bacteroidota bacterium]
MMPRPRPSIVKLLLLFCLSAGLLPTLVYGQDKMYWIDAGADKIQRANLDGSGVEDLIVAVVADPFWMALDAAGGKMYWGADPQGGEMQLFRANLDGTGRETLTGFSTQSEPYDVALDLNAGKFYFTDRGGPTIRIRTGNLDGTGVQFVFSDLDSVSGIALDLAAGKIYWGDPVNGIIHRGNMDGSGDIEDVVTGCVTQAGEQGANIGRLAVLGLIAGAPTVLGTWMGGFSYSPLWATLFLAIGVGAILQVIYQLMSLLSRRGETGFASAYHLTGFLLGLGIMYGTGLLVVS